MELLRPKLIVDRHALFPFQKKSLELSTGKPHSIPSFGRTIAYLAHVYLQRENEKTIRHNVRRCVEECRKFYILVQPANVQKSAELFTLVIKA